MTKNILGLDLGTNSIGWDLVEKDFLKKKNPTEYAGLRNLRLIALL